MNTEYVCISCILARYVCIWLSNKHKKLINSVTKENSSTYVHILTALQVLMSVFAFRYSKTFSKFPPLAALRKLALSSDCNIERKYITTTTNPQ